MADPADIAEIDPVLELTFGPNSLKCAGTLDFSTRRHVLEAVEMVLGEVSSSVGIDVSRLEVADADGAQALVLMQRMVRDAGVRLTWRALDEQLATPAP